MIDYPLNDEAVEAEMPNMDGMNDKELDDYLAQLNTEEEPEDQNEAEIEEPEEEEAVEEKQNEELWDRVTNMVK